MMLHSYLENLSSINLLHDVAPWDWKPSEPIPEEVKFDKKERDAWINRPSTKWCVYTLHEGVNNNVRISKARSDGEGNPVHCANGFVGDYDAKATLEEVKRFMQNLTYQPNWVERTLSGHWRFVWLLEEKIQFPSYEFALHFYATFSTFAFDLNRGMMGFDEPAFREPNRLWTNSGEWYHIHDTKLPADMCRGWLVQASKTYKKWDAEGPKIPIEDVRAALAEKFPKLSEWPTEFTVDSQGPTFWIDGSTSPKSAIVRETGIQTFSAHAPKAFYSWADLLGIAFVKKYQAEAMGRAVADVWFNGKHYYMRGTDGHWVCRERTDALQHLKVDRGVSTKAEKDGSSDLERAMCYIRNNQQVKAALPYVMQPGGLLWKFGRKVLNISDVRVLAPAEGKAVWGKDGPFPWISMFLEYLFPKEETRQHILSWAHRAYKGAYELKPQGGHALFIVGPVGIGKTMFSRAILAPLFGGLGEAGAFLLGEDNFNSELLGKYYWAVDDSEPTSSPDKFRRWTSGIKRCVANGMFRFNEKFKEAGIVEWLGRLVCTLNVDHESIQIIPDLSSSIRDKLIIVRTTDKPSLVFPERYELTKILERELPYFANFLLNYEIPEALKSTERFGVKDFADDSIVEVANQSCKLNNFNEVFNDWKSEFFRTNPTVNEWTGTAFQFHKELSVDPRSVQALKGLTSARVSLSFHSMLEKGFKGLEAKTDENGLKIWTIKRT